MALYKIENQKIRPIERTTFAHQSLKERANLQKMLKEQIDIISPDTLIIAEEFGDWEDSRRRIDLLGVDSFYRSCWDRYTIRSHIGIDFFYEFIKQNLVSSD